LLVIKAENESLKYENTVLTVKSFYEATLLNDVVALVVLMVPAKVQT